VEVEIELGVEDAMGELEEDSGLVEDVQDTKALVAMEAIATKPML